MWGGISRSLEFCVASRDLTPLSLAETASQGAKRATVTTLTPAGRAAIASLSVNGPGAGDLIAAHFRSASGQAIKQAPMGRILFGTWRHGTSNDIHEELVIVRVGEDSYELHCHGGHLAAGSIVAACLAAGASEQEPNTWLRSHFPRALEADAAEHLLKSETEREVAIFLQQTQGALRRDLEAAIEQIEGGHLAAADSRLAQLLARAPVGLRLGTPWRVVIAGAPNAGKSSLINRLLGYARSIVNPTPGTTRDRVRSHTAFHGWRFELIDTAGIRATREPIEAAGVDRASEAIRAADVVVWLHDISSGEPQLPASFEADPKTLVRVINKIDLVPQAKEPFPDWLAISAASGEGVDELVSALVARVVPEPPPEGGGVPFTVAQCEAIEVASDCIRRDPKLGSQGALDVLGELLKR